MKKFVVRATRLYEQSLEAAAYEASRLGLYERRWLGWVGGGVGLVGVEMALHVFNLYAN